MKTAILQKPNGKVSVEHHGNLYTYEQSEVCSCPECGDIDTIKKVLDNEDEDEGGYVIDKTTTVNKYRCNSCNCVFKITDTKRKIHRIRGGVGLVIAIICYIALLAALIINQLEFMLPKDGNSIRFISALLQNIKCCAPSIVGLLLVDHSDIYDAF